MDVILMALLTLPAQEGETKVRFDVKPLAAPRPSLKYQLLPSVDEIETGTALQLYLKCFMEQNAFYHDKAAVADREKWQTCALKDLPLDKVRNYGGGSLRYADQAARMSHLDWQIIGDIRKNGAFTLLPEVQKMRSLATALKVRLRGEIAERRFDAAAGTVKTMFKLGSQLGDHPSLIGNLVGIAVVSLAIPCLEEMIQEGGPNLYWALATLPSPLVSLRQGMQGERMFFVADLNRVVRDGRVDDAGLDKAIGVWGPLFKSEGGKGPDLKAYIKEHVAKAGHVEAARARLVEYGMAAAVVKEMTPAQVVLLDEQRLFEERMDESSRWLVQPYHLAEARLKAEEARGDGFFRFLLSHAGKVHRIQARAEQRLKLLRVLEALRLHAAAHAGALPKSLAEIDVPLPDDPFTGKPFRYEVKDGMATLRGTPPKAEEKSAAYNVVYEVKLTK